MIDRGQVWWADFGPPSGSGPGFRRPVVVVSSDAFNRSRIRTVVVALISSNTALGAAPGNVQIDAGTAGLDRDCVVNVSQIATLDKRQLDQPLGHMPLAVVERIDTGLRLALDLIDEPQQPVRGRR